MKILVLLLTSALLASAPLYAQTSSPTEPAMDAEALGLEKPLEKELSSIILGTLADKATLGTNSSADFAAVIRHAVAEIEKKGGAEADLKTARENAKKFGEALMKGVNKDKKAGELLAGRITRVELIAAMRSEAPLWPFTTDLPLTVPPSVQEIAPPPAE